jgi:hypothetical protein
MGLYDRLTDRIGDDNGEESSGGLTPLDIADLPPAQRKVMFSLLRDTKTATEGIGFDQLQIKLDHPEGLATTISELIKNNWLIAIGEEGNLRYKVNIRRKRSSSLGFGIWSSLSERITQRLDTTDSGISFKPKRVLPSAFVEGKRQTSKIDKDDTPKPDAPKPDTPTE